MYLMYLNFMILYKDLIFTFLFHFINFSLLLEKNKKYTKIIYSHWKNTNYVIINTILNWFRSWSLFNIRTWILRKKFF